MKLAYFGASKATMPVIRRWEQANDAQVSAILEGLSESTIDLARGHDGICLYLSRDMQNRESMYRQLHEYGMRQLSLTSAGIDGLNRQWAQRYGLSVTNVPSYSPTSVGHYALMLILMMLRGVPAAQKAPTLSRVMLGRELADVTVGIVGTGHIGSIVASAVKALGGHVVAYSSHRNPQLRGIADYVSFNELLALSDVISIHVPLTSATEHLFDDEAFSRMKPNSCLVNTARGGIVDTEALLRALENGRLAGAGIDTIEGEERYMPRGWGSNPLCQRLVGYPNTIVTPHIAYYTGRAVEEITVAALNNAKDILTTGRCANTVLVCQP
ncbi:NAD(P)-dependent oxidoreductase [Bifidobacterium sp.]|jgi:D-lactate dehydrogenase|uniref:NAD(P)-dependent oxidoreductase n=1 Tax=Bifidobacterium sp. TaxID=41200 RepID=UPI0025C724EE|nr:NAD(P)-dependent oxidoreductase [Bifidobacterium sp.]MCH4208813.1 hypothetical protein [Bifidobacterium sp.]MCI1224771.1 hypothetical protein [Bifidobacterium sp.]